MDAHSKVDAYIHKHAKFSEALSKLRRILIDAGQEETVKWGMPTYTVNGKNVTGIGAFKNHFGIWFFQGGLLKDAAHKLMNAQEGKTAAMRQWRFETHEEVLKNEKLIKSYVKEAIQNEKDGKQIDSKKPIRKPPSKMPELMSDFFKSNKGLEKSFRELTPGKQKEYIEYIVEAKRESTKKSRLEKIKPMIENGVGLNDRYK